MASSSSYAPCFGFSLAHWRNKQLESFFNACGLHHRTLQVDPETAIGCWFKPLEAQEHHHKPALVLIHGFATSGLWQWNQQVKPFQKSFQLFIPDLVFFGKSTTSTRHRSEIFQAEMIAKAMEMVQVPSYSVVGTSYGGFVAFRLAHLFPERVEKVVIANSGVCMVPEDNQELLERAKLGVVADLLLPRTPAALRTLLSLTSTKFPFYMPTFILNDILQFFYMEKREERVELLDGLLLGKEDSESLPNIMQKVLLIWGDQDGIFPPKLAHRLKEHFKENAELVIFKNMSHVVQLENPREFNRLVETFLLSDGT